MTESSQTTEAQRSSKRESLADMVAAETGAPSLRVSFALDTRLKVLVLAGLFIFLNFWQFRGLIRAWRDYPNWSHGFIIPLFSLYMIYSRWSEIAAAKRRICLWGLPIVVIGILAVVLGNHPPINHRFVSQVGMTLLLFGLVLYLAGPRMAKLTWLPIFYLVFAMPIPDSIYTRIALPLQNLAAAGSTVILRLFGVQISRVRSMMTVVGASGTPHPLRVAEACAGMRLLVAFLALGVAMAYLGDRPLWQRLIMVAAAIPIAVVCNVIRVAITSAMFAIDKPELGQDFMHGFTGIVMLVPAFVMLWLLGLLLRSLFVEVEEDEAGGDEADQGPAREAKA